MNREPTIPDEPGEELLSAYLDGECSDAERTWVEEQLAASPALRVVLEEVRAARDAVRSLPLVDPPPELWTRILAPEGDGPDGDAAAPGDPDGEGGPSRDPVADLSTRRRRGPARWIAAAAAAAVAAVVAAVALAPEERTVTPPVATFAEAHAVRSSLQDDAVSTLAPLAVQARFPR